MLNGLFNALKLQEPSETSDNSTSSSQSRDQIGMPEQNDSPRVVGRAPAIIKATISDAPTTSAPAPASPSANDASDDEIWGSQIWFDGVGSHDDFFIDLQGNSTDHLPDVRMYLIIIGSEEARRTWSVPDPEKDESRIQRGKELLLESWKKGKGAFLDPHKPGRHYQTFAACDDGTCFGVPWYSDIRGKNPPRRGSWRRGSWGDVGWEQNSKYREPLDWTKNDGMFNENKTMMTNLRSPLPPIRYFKSLPSNRDEWYEVVRRLYWWGAHPAGLALADWEEKSARELDLPRYECLRSLLVVDWREYVQEADSADEEECEPEVWDGIPI